MLVLFFNDYCCCYNLSYMNFMLLLQSAVTSLSFIPNSEQIITASKDGTIRIWNINGKFLRHNCELYDIIALMVSGC
jgi:WD40 repeat protein